ncbi:Ankyrin repeat domain-containing protein 54 [Colletotrichum sp. SAR 10_77]|nr:Ankyrin repeat domain-containing protein 54 [Colletotrichum sp. SAR 10_76]KAI8222115.1 Ankyrin repeat domain-containing protein 54 [Colletotrichum sp. SAR 10_77]
MADKRLTFSVSDLATPAPRQELPPAKQTDTASRAHLLELPVEIILQIVDAIFNSHLESLQKGYNEPEECDYYWYPEHLTRFSVWRTVIRLAKTCKALKSIVTPALYRADIKWNRGSSLLLAAKTGSTSAIRKALKAGAEIDMWDFTELYANFEYIHDRTTFSHYHAMREPLDIEMTALHWAAYHRHVDAISVLLEHGADIRAMGSLGPDFDPQFGGDKLRFACAPYLRVASRIKTHFSGLRSCENWLGDVLRGMADDEGANVVYYALLEKYEPANLSGQPDYTQEQRTRRDESKIAAVKTLLQAGASMTTHSITLLHALHQACGNWDEEMVEFLLENGADVHIS